MHTPVSLQKTSALVCLLLAVLFVPLITLHAQTAEPVSPPERPHAIEFSPMSPIFRIYVLQYAHKIGEHGELLVGPYYANIEFKDIGNTNAPGILVGYRHYLWGNLHVEYQVIPQWDHFYEKNERRHYPQGFDLWNEFRVGYTFEFNIGSLPAFANVQWPFGWALYSDGNAKPESFKRHTESERFFYFPPMLFLGVRF